MIYENYIVVKMPGNSSAWHFIQRLKNEFKEKLKGLQDSGSIDSLLFNVKSAVIDDIVPLLWEVDILDSTL